VWQKRCGYKQFSWRMVLDESTKARDRRLSHARRAQKRSDLWRQAAEGRNWHIYPFGGHEYAIDIDAVTLMAPPKFKVERDYFDDDFVRLKILNDYQLQSNRHDWRITGL
jgi:hypothetical protein